jgi:spore coat polysaccharide biosynthesis protein SpsF
METFRIFIQARMSSSRFPGKMLAPFQGKPLIANVIERFAAAGLSAQCVVTTSLDSTDDPLADYVESRLKVPVFRGDLTNVTRRFQDASRAYPATWIVRISGDSPMIDAGLVAAVAGYASKDADIVSNVVRRTFPAGQSVECLRARVLAAVDAESLGADDREHVMPYFYRHVGRNRIRSVVCRDAHAVQERHVVDTLDDLRNLERDVSACPHRFSRFGGLVTLDA